MGQRRMLVVDDERDICELLQAFFQSRGFSVVTVFSGEEALDKFTQDPPDIVLLDILLPGISGIEVLRRIKPQCPRTRIVMVTALDSADLRVEAHHYGAAGYVTKPFDFSDETWFKVLA